MSEVDKNSNQTLRNDRFVVRHFKTNNTEFRMKINVIQGKYSQILCIRTM